MSKHPYREAATAALRLLRADMDARKAPARALARARWPELVVESGDLARMSRRWQWRAPSRVARILAAVLDYTCRAVGESGSVTW